MKLTLYHKRKSGYKKDKNYPTRYRMAAFHAKA
ncbi:hypothetical protein SAMN05216167_1234 [Spirosoma endophyticum]|uniref:Uncharacterized protein n=1 Tax=Spirosoma endophyticum TaxID=662367 RepID=A0A1I2ES14_9BACT|nr:hypothetical protein SAMN05216167_1234 [Spirosoma endophyticum]